MREANPLSNLPDNRRYDENRDTSRGPSATFNFHGSTLEEEAANKGWIATQRPTGDAPLPDLMTIGMRGEPGWDDDPQFDNGSGYMTHGSTSDGDISDSD